MFLVLNILVDKPRSTAGVLRPDLPISREEIFQDTP